MKTTILFVSLFCLGLFISSFTRETTQERYIRQVNEHALSSCYLIDDQTLHVVLTQEATDEWYGGSKEQRRYILESIQYGWRKAGGEHVAVFNNTDKQVG